MMRESKKEILRIAGFNKQVDLINVGLCPTCEKVIDPDEFDGELSRREHKISGLCQACQDDIFNKG